ncbi:hypothetical protein FHX11_005788 [Rhizobium sp. BK602]|nr:hypothetical protein [Rhizobium sp. BK602]
MPQARLIRVGVLLSGFHLAGGIDRIDEKHRALDCAINIHYT